MCLPAEKGPPLDRKYMETETMQNRHLLRAEGLFPTAQALEPVPGEKG
jgi:hypothetical protein